MPLLFAPALRTRVLVLAAWLCVLGCHSTRLRGPAGRRSVFKGEAGDAEPTEELGLPASDYSLSNSTLAVQPNVSVGAARRDSVGGLPKTLAGEAILPLLWLHVPKTGSSFATTLAHFGCPGIPSHTVVKEPTWQNPSNTSAAALPFNQRYPMDVWCKGSFARFTSGHQPLPMLTSYRNVVGMFRSPRYRTLSGYFHNYHDCPAMRQKYGCPNEYDREACKHLYAPVSIFKQQYRLKEYDNCVRDCQAHMLTGQMCGTGSTSPASFQAAASVVTQLGFVGLTEEWALSICLFHARFGGTCYKSSFKNLRPGTLTHKYDEAARLMAWPVGTDEAVYNKAVARFWQEAKAFGVTKARCRTSICPAAAEYFQDQVSFVLNDDA
eukprot:TRINITY_DN92352_c0_g1_i1.p1 TRINITY_DN92352_c0_g1~~TRINITY_DN92352_c0_g1_i1.p1  ORF type:complete len:380 (+),score=28.96 TRINITY_DN92352_c0_g1_i1:43-1182(+)